MGVTVVKNAVAGVTGVFQERTLDASGQPKTGLTLDEMLYHADGISLKPLLAMHIGISAPLVLKAMAAIAPERPPERTD